MDNGSGGKDYRTCVQKSGIKLPTGYFFGLSVSSRLFFFFFFYSPFFLYVTLFDLFFFFLGCLSFTCR